MSIKLMSAVWDIPDPELNGARLLTLLCLADHAGDDGKDCYPSIPRLAERSKVSERQVTRVLQWLEAQDYIRILEKGTGRGRRTNYYLWLKGDVLSLNTRKGDKVSSYSHRKGDICDIKGDICDTERVTFKTPITPILAEQPSVDPSVDPSVAEGEPAAAAIDPDTAMVWEKWQRNMSGTLTEIIASKLHDLIDEYGAPDVVRAITIQVERGKHGAGVRYLEGILRNGIDTPKPTSNGYPSKNMRAMISTVELAQEYRGAK